MKTPLPLFLIIETLIYIESASKLSLFHFLNTFYSNKTDSCKGIRHTQKNVEFKSVDSENLESMKLI